MSCDRCGAELRCLVCDTAIRQVPDTTGREWMWVAACTETRRSPTPLHGHLGPSIFPEFDVEAGSAVARNVVPPLHGHIRSEFVTSIGEEATRDWEQVNYGHAVPTPACWFAMLHCHVPRACPCDNPVPYDVPECCEWPMHLSPSGWRCRVERSVDKH